MNHKAPSTAGKIAAVRAVHTMRPELAHLVRLASSRVDGAGGARTVKITVADYQKAAGFDLADAAEAVQALIRRQISAGGEGRSEINWLEKYELYDSGRASLVFSIQALPYLHALKIHFEEHPTSDTDGVRSLYARRLIEWFDLHAETRQEVTLEELRDLLDIPPSYSTAALRQRALDPPIAELASRGWAVSYRMLKDGRAYQSIVFDWRRPDRK
ncbi:replication initiation protein [Thiolapillus sp.]|uniref:replication initiation protein n=6 Tax=Thiolapillus sp. TaxID=2017437 RepID=UPI0025ECF275|nr:replication initiation protein [Thiolapillus sp.]